MLIWPRCCLCALRLSICAFDPRQGGAASEKRPGWCSYDPASGVWELSGRHWLEALGAEAKAFFNADNQQTAR